MSSTPPSILALITNTDFGKSDYHDDGEGLGSGKAGVGGKGGREMGVWIQSVFKNQLF